MNRHCLAIMWSINFLTQLFKTLVGCMRGSLAEDFSRRLTDNGNKLLYGELPFREEHFLWRKLLVEMASIYTAP